MQLPFRFSGSYYPQFLRDLIRYLAYTNPEFSKSDPSEPHMQLLAMFANVLHYNSVMTDHLALESIPYTARLYESVRQHLKMIGYNLSLAVPSRVELLARLDRALPARSEIVIPGAIFETDSEVLATDETIRFEYTEPISLAVGPTNRVSKIFSLVNLDEPRNTGAVDSTTPTIFTKVGGINFAADNVGDFIFIENSIHSNGGLYRISEVLDNNNIVISDADFASEADLRWSVKRYSDDGSRVINELNANYWHPYFAGSDETVYPNDIIYISHSDIMWDRTMLNMATFLTNIDGVWEYYDKSSSDVNPNSVINLGDELVFDLTDLLGSDDRRNTLIRVEYSVRETHKEVHSYYEAGVNKVKIKGFMGQTSPSTNTQDYLVGNNWKEFLKLSDLSDNLSSSGRISYELPQSERRNWIQSNINEEDGYWLRFRVLNLTSVHGEEDTPIVIASFATNLATAIAVAGTCKTGYNNHVVKVGYIHRSGDTTFDDANPVDLAELMAFLNAFKTDINDHFASHTIHYNADSDNTILTNDATDLATAITLVNNIYLSLNAHLGEEVPSLPQINHVNIREGGQYLLFEGVQGETVREVPLGSSNGLENQEFELRRALYIGDTLRVDVEEESGVWIRWSRVDSLLYSNSGDRHYIVDTDGDGITKVRFGGILKEDGDSYGMVPPMGVGNVNAYYRVGAENDGNVGANTVSVVRGGLNVISSITNPRSANGWQEREGLTQDSLMLAKERGSASLRHLGKAITTEDVEFLALDWTNPDTGEKPIIRAIAIAEAYGPKTVGLWVVGTNGNFISDTIIEDLEEYFNGDSTASPIKYGVMLANTQVIVQNYERRVVNLTITVRGGDEDVIRTTVLAVVNPTYRDEDNELLWDFGGELAYSKIVDAIHNLSSAIKSVRIAESLPDGDDLILGEFELPYTDPTSVSITVV